MYPTFSGENMRVDLMFFGALGSQKSLLWKPIPNQDVPWEPGNVSCWEHPTAKEQVDDQLSGDKHLWQYEPFILGFVF